MTLKELVLDHLRHTFDQEAWQPPLALAIEGLSASQAAWKPSPERRSTWEIVRHVTHWKQAVLEAFEGRAVPSLADLERTDWPAAQGDEAAWRADVERLRAISRRLEQIVRAASDAELSEPVTTFADTDPQPRAMRLVRMATHDIYHAGQVQYLRALQGA